MKDQRLKGNLSVYIEEETTGHQQKRSFYLGLVSVYQVGCNCVIFVVRMMYCILHVFQFSCCVCLSFLFDFYCE